MRVFFQRTILMLRQTSENLCTHGRRLPKSARFAFLGAAGCLFGALVGEGLLAATRVSIPADAIVGARSICLAIDSSGSMKGGKLVEVQRAARNFVERQDLTRNRFAVVQFANDATLAVPITSDRGQIGSAIDQMSAAGGTAMHLGLEVAQEALSAAAHPRHILLFTDGMPTNESLALAAARNARYFGTQIIAIGTGDADQEFLSKVTGNPALVLWASSGRFENAFAAAERLIASASLVDASSGYELGAGIGRTGAWSALLALGLAAFLIAAQNCYLRRALFSKRDILFGVAGSIAAGFLAGGAGQGTFWLARSDMAAHALDSIILGAVLGAAIGLWSTLTKKQVSFLAGFGALAGCIIAIGSQWLWFSMSGFYWVIKILHLPAWGLTAACLLLIALRLEPFYVSGRAFRVAAVIGVLGWILLCVVETFIGDAAMLLTDVSTRIVGWITLGALVGFGLAFLIPNLNRRHALAAGAVSGLTSAVLYLVTGAHLGGGTGRLVGAMALGASMGWMIIIAEAVCREHWLELTYAPNDKRIVNLGSQAVRVGGDRIVGHTSRECEHSKGFTYRVENGSIVCHEKGNGRLCRLNSGESRIVNGTQITVRSRNQ